MRLRILLPLLGFDFVVPAVLLPVFIFSYFSIGRLRATLLRLVYAVRSLGNSDTNM